LYRKKANPKISALPMIPSSLPIDRLARTCNLQKAQIVARTDPPGWLNVSYNRQPGVELCFKPGMEFLGWFKMNPKARTGNIIINRASVFRG
jgi:hypothetical protein